MTEKLALILADNTFRKVLAKVNPNQWLGDTPNTGWTVHDLVAHNLEALVWMPHVLSGKTISEAGDTFAGDVMGTNPKIAWDIASTAADLAMADLDLDTIVHLSYADVTARTYLQHQSIDFTIHAWDLAQALGHELTVDPHLVGKVYEWFTTEANGWRNAGLLGPAIPVPDSASIQTRLLALSGRQEASKI